MRIEIAQHERMSESGSSLLRLIQNQEMPLLDLLVRESVQNSLDASNGKPFVSVDISIRPFQSKDLSKHLEGITEKLNARYGDQVCNSIVVSDSNTTGLTGPVKYEDVKGLDFGNCLKLIYEISKPQTNEGAGGSWGLGKTIYFRLGMGLVIYYSRIFQDGKYKSRLAACLVEDETKKGSLIPSSSGVKRGIAWWGAAAWGQKTTVPIEDEKEIARILELFKVSPYKNDDTGTTIIMPYIDDNKLLQEVYAKNDDAGHKPYWVTSLEEYLKIAFQRWYAPRILNTTYDGAYLRPSVNGELIKVSSLNPLFKVIRELYIYACTGSVPEDSLIAESKAIYQVEEIRTREVFVRGSSSAGKFAYLKLSNEQLMMTPPNNKKSPYQQVANREIIMENGNTPIVMFTRKPGMIVAYDYNGAWTHRMPKTNESEYVIGLFVANSTNRLVDVYDSTNNPLTLEEYIRQGEKADHASWSDRSIGGTNPRVITKIQNGIIRTIATKYKEKPNESVERQNIGLAHALANILLPSRDFGHRSTDEGSGGAGSGGSSVRSGKPTISLWAVPTFENGLIVFDYEASLKKGYNNLHIGIVTDYRKYYSDTWENDSELGKRFPVSFSEMQISERKERDKRGSWENYSISLQSADVTSDGIGLSFVPSDLYKIKSCIMITCDKNWLIKGKVKIKSDDLKLKVTIDIKGVS